MFIWRFISISLIHFVDCYLVGIIGICLALANIHCILTSPCWLTLHGGGVSQGRASLLDVEEFYESTRVRSIDLPAVGFKILHHDFQ